MQDRNEQGICLHYSASRSFDKTSMSNTSVERDAHALYDEHARRTRFRSAPPPSATTVRAAYDVQRAYVALLRRDAGAVVGYKIGLTSPRMQAMCGIAEPVCGAVLAQRVHRSGVQLKRSDHGRLGLEFEIAVRIGRDTRIGASLTYTADTVRVHVDGVCAALEVVDDRHADYSALDVRGLVADNAWNAGVVLSDFVARGPTCRRWKASSVSMANRSIAASAATCWVTRWGSWPGWRTTWPHAASV